MPVSHWRTLLLFFGLSALACVHGQDTSDWTQPASDYEQTFRVLKALPVDLFLGAHGNYYGMAGKHARLGKGETGNPFMDAAGYQAYVADREQAFLVELRKQQAAKE